MLSCSVALYSASSHTVVFILEQSNCHKKLDEYALTPKRILKKDGGPHRVRDTVWDGNHFPMVNPDGTAKGLETILKERGILEPALKNLKADNM